MLYKRRSRSSAFLILLTSTTALALYIPHSKVITTTTTTTTNKATYVWSDQNQNQQSDPFHEDTTTPSFTCFECPMNSKLLREIRIFASTGESRVSLKNPEPRALVCEYDTNESPCRYHPATGILLADQPSGDSCPRSASISPKCRPIPRKAPSQFPPDGERESEAKIVSPIAPSRGESEQGRHLRDSLLSFETEHIFEAILSPAKTDSQFHFSALEAAPRLRYPDPEDEYNYDPLNLGTNPPSPPSQLSLDEPSTPPLPIDFRLDLKSAFDEEKDYDLTPLAEVTPTERTVGSHENESDPRIDLLLDLEFEDYSDVLRLSQVVIPPYPGRRPQDQKMDAEDLKSAYIMSTITGE